MLARFSLSAMLTAKMIESAQINYVLEQQVLACA